MNLALSTVRSRPLGPQSKTDKQKTQYILYSQVMVSGQVIACVQRFTLSESDVHRFEPHLIRRRKWLSCSAFLVNPGLLGFLV